MKFLWQKLHRIGDILHLPELPNWMCGLLFLILILRIPSFFEPYYYGDEMIYLTLGEGVRQGATLYKDVHDNKPPLLYLTAALAGNLFWFKAILAFWSMATIFAFFKLSELLFPKRKKIQRISTVIFAVLTTIPLLEGNIVNSELFMIGLGILAFVLLLKGGLNKNKVFLSGLLFGVATLFKVPAMFDLPVIIVYWLVTDTKNWKTTFKNSLVLISGFLLPILATMAWYFTKGVFSEYLVAAFLQNVGYLSTFRPDDIQKPFLLKNFPLILRAVIVVSGLGGVYFFRNKLSKQFILLTIWMLFALFAITLSERPYPHYLIQAIAPLAMFMAMLITERTIEQVLVIFPITLFLIAPVYYKFYIYPTTGYYLRFLNFATQKVDKETYFANFSSTVNRNYKIAEFLANSSIRTDRVFMWDPDSSVVYALSRRLPPIKYVADYHINDFSSIDKLVDELESKNPKFIILTSNHPLPEITPLIKRRYVLIHQIENADIYSRLNLDL